MIEREELQEILYDFFDKIIDSKIPIVFENQNGVRPVPPFISTGFTSIATLGTTPYNYPYLEHKVTYDDSSEESRDVFLEKIKQPVERSVTIRGFGEESEEYLNIIRNSLFFDDYINLLSSKKIVIKSIENILENASNYSEDSEIFYSMDLIVAYERIIAKETTYIEHMEVEGTVTNIDGSTRDIYMSNASANENENELT